MKPTLPLLIGTLLLVGSGLVHGMWTGRWQSAESLARAASAVDLVPKTIGDWDTVRETEVSDEEKKVAELAGSLARQYRNRRTGDVVSLLLMCGKPGPISVHPPTACYTGLGYQQVGSTRTHRCSTGEQETLARHEFQTAQFASPKRGDSLQPRIYWSWSVNGVWHVPDNPRLSFAGGPALFKIYVAFESDDVTKSKVKLPPERFLEELLPVLREHVFASVAQGDE